MNTICTVAVAAALAAGAASATAATSMSEVDAASACKARAASQYAAGERTARIKFKGIYGGADRLKVRMQVLPAEGRVFLAICEVSRSAQTVVGIAPGPRGAPTALAVAAN